MQMADASCRPLEPPYTERARHDLPHGLTMRKQRDLVALLRAATGIEAVVALRDVARVPRDGAPKLLLASAGTILQTPRYPSASNGGSARTWTSRGGAGSVAPPLSK
jgi:hypothetical protein